MAMSVSFFDFLMPLGSSPLWTPPWQMKKTRPMEKLYHETINLQIYKVSIAGL